MARQISVLLADDHVLVRQGIRRFLESAGDIKVVGEAGDGEEVMRYLVQSNPDVVILDLHMPQMGGLEVTQQIKANYPRVRILVLTADDENPQVLALLRAGADGYLLKTARIEAVIRAVREVHAGNVALSPEVATTIVRQVSSVPRAAEISSGFVAAAPTAREIAVLRFAAQGMTNREIGQALSISHRTVQGHLANLYTKLQVNTRTEAVTEALKRGWISLK